VIGSAANIKEKQDLYMIIKKKAFINVTVAALMVAEIMLVGCAAQKDSGAVRAIAAQVESTGAGTEPGEQAAAASTQKPVESTDSSQKTDTPAAPSSPSETASAGSTEIKLYLDYIDSWGEWHTMVVDPTVPGNDYDPEKFVTDESDPQRLTYDDPDYTVLQGIDVYEGTGAIDWVEVADAGYSFAFVRVGYRGYGEAGKLCEDYMAVENLRAAKAAGFKVGAYFFSQALDEEEAREEALTAIKVIEESGVELDLPLMYDPEIIKNDDGRANDITREQVALNTKTFRETVESSTDYKVDIYTNLPWEDELFEGDILADFDIWYADYEKIPQTPYHFTWLQYSNTGVVPGIEGDVDLNLWIRREGEE